jgi:hypothetical protein
MGLPEPRVGEAIGGARQRRIPDGLAGVSELHSLVAGHAGCLSLAWAVLDRASRGWRGVDQRPANVRLLQQLGRALLGPPPPERQGRDAPAEPVVSAA